LDILSERVTGAYGTMAGPQPGDWTSAGGTISGSVIFRSGKRTRRCALAGSGGWSARQQTFPAGRWRHRNDPAARDLYKGRRVLKRCDCQGRSKSDPLVPVEN
jgi:hypothetical protein